VYRQITDERRITQQREGAGDARIDRQNHLTGIALGSLPMPSASASAVNLLHAAAQ
jgi:hypothetical protein